jgi:adenylate cyclase
MIFKDQKSVARWKNRGWLILIGSACVAATVGLGRTDLFHKIHLKALDANYLPRIMKRSLCGTAPPVELPRVLKHRMCGADPDVPVKLITINQQSLDDPILAQPLIFWHQFYAEAIRAAAAAGAKAFVLDVTFTIPVTEWVRGYDEAIAAAVIENAQRMPVIVAYAPGTLENQERMAIPINMFAASFERGGYANLTADTDDFVRKIELMEEPRTDRPTAKSMSLRAMEAYYGETASYKDGRISLKGSPIPTVAPRTMLINYAGGPGYFPRIPFREVIHASRRKDTGFLERELGGRIILLGLDTIDDRHATPFYKFEPGERANSAGVEIHANAVATILNRAYLREVPVPFRIPILGFLSLICLVCGNRLSGRRLLWAGVGVLALVIGIPLLLFQSGWMVAMTELFISSAMTVVAVFIYRSNAAETRGSLFHKAISVFVGGKLAKALEETGKIPIAGNRQTVTILFTDIRGFTAYCESKDPTTVVASLNEYFSRMVPCIVREHGMVDKFIGDGIMAIFADEEDTVAGDHPLRAVRAALAMVTQPGEFKTGAGIHTGVAVIGTIGSADKMDFTALGDTVNLSSRLESLNKEYKTRMLVSETTYESVKDRIPMVCLGQVQVRGKAVPMNIYTAAELQQPAA